MGNRILVVEDNHITLRMLRTVLAAEGHEVIEARDARTALAEAERNPPDLVLMDLVLPDMDGVDLLPRLRSLIAGDVPILALSGFLSRLGESRTLGAGFTALLLKPIEPAVLVDAISSFLPLAVPSAATGARRLLLVDDDPVQLKLGRLRFLSEGFDVIAVGHADEAMAAARAKSPAVVLSDVFMPDVDGFQLCLQIRQDLNLAAVPVVLMSNQYVSSADRDLARRVGADDLVLRTPDFAQARAAVSKALGSGRPSPLEAPTDELRLKHARLVIQQLERQVAGSAGLVRRCALQSAQIALLTGVAEALMRSADTDQALNDLLAATLDAAGISKGALLRLDAGGALQLQQVVGFSEDERRALADGFGHLELFQRIVDDGVSVSIPSPVISSDVAHDVLVGANVASVHVVPLVSKGERLGALVIAATGTDATSQDSMVFARAMASQVAQSLTLTRSVARTAASEARYRTLLHSANDVIATLTPDGILTGVNRRGQEVLGRSEAELVGHHFREFAPPEYADHNVQALGAAVARGVGRTAAVAVANGEGGISWIELSQAMVEIGGEPVVFAIGRDVTQQRLLEDQLRQAQKLEAVGQLAGGVAHDFNNVLTAILGFTQLLMIGLSPGDERLDLLSEIRKAGDRAAGLTRQLLAFSRKQILQPKVIDVNQQIAGIEPMLRQLTRADIELRMVLAPEMRAIRIDPTQLEQILVNLIVNAAHAMPSGGTLTIETGNVQLTPTHRGQLPLGPGDYAMIAVSDTGTGMDAETERRIFEPFFTTKGIGQGTGLGLSTVHGIVKQSGGDISVDSELGQGSTFKIYLPTVAHHRAESISATVLEAPVRGSETVLLVEDDGGVRLLARLTLEQAGYLVLEAENPTEALRVTNEWRGPIDLLLSDLVMPGATSAPLFDLLRPAHPGLRLLYMSGYTDDAIVRHGMFIEGLPFLAKPFAPDALTEKVREVLSTAPPT